MGRYGSGVRRRSGYFDRQSTAARARAARGAVIAELLPASMPGSRWSLEVAVVADLVGAELGVGAALDELRDVGRVAYEHDTRRGRLGGAVIAELLPAPMPGSR